MADFEEFLWPSCLYFASRVALSRVDVTLWTVPKSGSTQFPTSNTFLLSHSVSFVSSAFAWEHCEAYLGLLWGHCEAYLGLMWGILWITEHCETCQRLLWEHRYTLNYWDHCARHTWDCCENSVWGIPGIAVRALRGIPWDCCDSTVRGIPRIAVRAPRHTWDCCESTEAYLGLLWQYCARYTWDYCESTVWGMAGVR
jgi:hypothetical protein